MLFARLWPGTDSALFPALQSLCVSFWPVWRRHLIQARHIPNNIIPLARLANPASNNFGQQASVAGTRAIPVIVLGLNTTNDATFAGTIQRGLAGSLANTIASKSQAFLFPVWLMLLGKALLLVLVRYVPHSATSQCQEPMILAEG